MVISLYHVTPSKHSPRRWSHLPAVGKCGGLPQFISGQVPRSPPNPQLLLLLAKPSPLLACHSPLCPASYPIDFQFD